MRGRTMGLWVAGMALVGCAGPGSGDGAPDGAAKPSGTQHLVPVELRACVDDAAFREALTLLDASSEALLEVADCGRALLDFAAALRPRVIVRNARAFGFTGDTLQANVWGDRGNAFVAAFVHQPDGAWRMLSSNPNLRFEVGIHAQFGALVVADPFELDAYFEDAVITSDAPPDSMLAAPSQVTTFRIHYTRLGPLAGLLTPDARIGADTGSLPNPVVLELSLNDLIDPDAGDGSGWGPLRYLDRLWIASEIESYQPAEASDVTYVMDSPTQRFTGDDGVAFELAEFEALGDDVSLSGSTYALRVGAEGVRSGNFIYALRDADGAQTGLMIVDSQGGDGRTSWYCEGETGPRWRGPQGQYPAVPPPPAPID